VNGLWAAPSGRGKRFLCSAKCPDRFWSPPSLLLNVYLGINPPGCEANQSLQLWLRKSESILDLLSCIIAIK